MHGTHDGCCKWDQEATETQKCWVTETLCEITLGLTWLEEQSLILFLTQGIRDLPAQVIPAHRLHQLLAVDAVLVVVRSHCCAWVCLCVLKGYEWLSFYYGLTRRWLFQKVMDSDLKENKRQIIERQKTGREIRRDLYTPECSRQDLSSRYCTPD